MKIGDKGDSYSLVRPSNAVDDGGWETCQDINGEDLVFGNYDDALNGTDDAIENYGGQTIYIMKTTWKIVEEILVPKIDGEGNVTS